jgi:hypothetical protein
VRRNAGKSDTCVAFAGQQAMALAMIYPEPEKGGRGNIGAAKEAKKLGGLMTSAFAKRVRCCGSPPSWRGKSSPDPAPVASGSIEQAGERVIAVRLGDHLVEFRFR